MEREFPWEAVHCCYQKYMLSLVDNFVNIASMLRQLYTCFDHPNPYRRLGAAMTAHLIYPVLRENGSIVDHHILEILFFLHKESAYCRA
jgi:hypothetical protein